jgi:Ca2+-binding RTX toxin-like protein
MADDSAFSITAYGASAGAADNNKAIQKAIDAARAQDKDVLVPNEAFKHNGTLKLDGVKIYGEGENSALIGTDRTHLALQLSGDDAGVSNLRLQSSEGSRLSSYESAAISVIGATNFTISDVDIQHAGIHITNSSKGLVQNNTLTNTHADSIHMSNLKGPNSDIIVRGNEIDQPHDDGVAVVSYGGSRSKHAASHDILVENNSVTNQEWGRGYTVVGGYDVTIRNNFYDNNKSGAAGVYIASEGSYQTLGVSNVHVEDNLIKNAGGKKHAAIQVYADNNPVTDVHIVDNVIYASKAGNVVTNGSSGATNIYVKGNLSYGPVKGLTDFVGSIDGSKTIESNNTVLPKSAYPGDKAFDVAGAPGSSEPQGSLPVLPKPTNFEEGAWILTEPPGRTVTGSARNEMIHGGDTGEMIDGRGGDDTLLAGKGDDVYLVNSRGDKVVESAGQGVDTVSLSISDYVLPDEVENLVVNYDSKVTIVGNSLDNVITGGEDGDTIDGANGSDHLSGGPGNDIFVFSKGELQGDEVMDFENLGAQTGDALRFEGFGSGAELTAVGDVWTVQDGETVETFKLVGVTALNSSDITFA